MEETNENQLGDAGSGAHDAHARAFQAVDDAALARVREAHHTHHHCTAILAALRALIHEAQDPN